MIAEPIPKILNRYFKIGSQCAFIGIFLFEVANKVHLLHSHIEYTWFGLAFTSLVSFFSLLGIDLFLQRKKLGQLDGVIWALCFFMIFVDVMGDVWGFYGRFVWYDQVAHFESGALLGFVLLRFFGMLRKHSTWTYPAIFDYAWTLGFDSMLALLYEVEEYLEDYFFHSHRLGDGPDTANDLFLNWIACVGVLIGIYCYRRWRSHRTKNHDL